MNFKDIAKKLAAYPNHKLVFVALGNPMRGDDAAGLLFAQRMQDENLFPGAHFIKAGTNPENHLSRILQSQPACVVFIDASDWGALPGEMSWLQGDKIDTAGISTHAFSIRMIETYLKMHDVQEINYLAIQPNEIGLGNKVSDKVRMAIGLN
jgi:hydrogenase 3 maturation protease